MARQEVVLRVFVAFPEDLVDEAGAVEASAEEINANLSRDLGRRLEVITWRNVAGPGVSTDPQAVINEHVGDNYDIVIGLLGTRFGTPTPRAGSGTKEEFERAYGRYMASSGSVRLMIYFKRAPIEFDQNIPAQIEAINVFRSKLGPKGVLFWDFRTREEFETYLRMHLSREVRAWGKTWGQDCLSTTSKQTSVPSDGAVEEGLLDLIERATEGFQIAAEAMDRIGKLHDQMAVRISERTAQIEATPSLPEGQRQRFAKQVINSAAVDLDQFAKGLSSETAVLSEYFLSAVEALSRSFTYTECYRPPDTAATAFLGKILDQLFNNMEGFRKAMVGLREASKDSRVLQLTSTALKGLPLTPSKLVISSLVVESNCWSS